MKIAIAVKCTPKSWTQLEEVHFTLLLLNSDSIKRFSVIN